MLEYNDVSEDHTGLIQANSDFYQAFGFLDIKGMEEVWSHSDMALCIHPGWEPLFTWEHVRSSWENIFMSSTLMMFTIEVIKSFVESNIGTVVCKENISSVINGRATNFAVLAVNKFELHSKQWKLVYHHGSPIG